MLGLGVVVRVVMMMMTMMMLRRTRVTGKGQRRIMRIMLRLVCALVGQT